jgi:hypothetical protein
MLAADALSSMISDQSDHHHSLTRQDETVRSSVPQSLPSESIACDVWNLLSSKSPSPEQYQQFIQTLAAAYVSLSLSLVC